MSVEDFYEDFWFQDIRSIPDGLGGIKKEFLDGMPFRAACRQLSSTEAELAYRTGVKTIYRITLPEGIALSQGDYVRRKRDGRVYRITSEPAAAPAAAQNVGGSYVSAEVFA